MKITLKIPALALLAALTVSCSLDQVREVNPGEAISFRSFANNMTRATPVTQQNIGDLYVYAYDDASALYFSDVYSTTDQSIWTSTPANYWPSDPAAVLTFLAFNGGALDQDKTKILGGTLNMTNPEEAKIENATVPIMFDDHKDIVVARTTGSQTADGTDGVGINFKHILSQVRVMAKSSNDQMKVEVAGVKLAYLANTGSYTFPKNGTTTDNNITQDSQTSDLIANTWVVTNPEQHVYGEFMYKVDDYAAPITLTAADAYVTPQDEGFMVMPQTVGKWNGNADADGAYISVLCRISVLVKDAVTGSENWEQRFPGTQGSYAFTAVPVDVAWQPGYTYTYKLEFFADGGGGAGEADPDPEDPNPDPDPDPEIDPNPGVDPGDPVIGGEIKLKVTVDRWIENTIEKPMGGPDPVQP